MTRFENRAAPSHRLAAGPTTDQIRHSKPLGIGGSLRVASPPLAALNDGRFASRTTDPHCAIRGMATEILHREDTWAEGFIDLQRRPPRPLRLYRRQPG